MVNRELIEVPVTKTSFELLGQFAEHDGRSVPDIVEIIVAMACGPNRHRNFE